jgi:hypothetical protein
VTLSEFHPDLLESRQTNATVKLRRRIDRVMAKRGRLVGHSVDRFRYNAPYHGKWQCFGAGLHSFDQ